MLRVIPYILTERVGVIVPVFWDAKRLPAWVRYGVALVLVAFAACCNYLLPPVYGESHYFFFSAAILAGSLFGGLGPGLLATAVSALTSAYFFIAPFHSFRIEAPETAQRLAMFIVEGAIISSVGQVIKNNRTPELVSTLGRYTSAAVLVGGAVILKLMFFPALEQRLPFTFFYSAIVVTSWVAGAAPGFLAIALSAACIYLLFSGYEIYPGKPGLLLFVLEATGLCLLTATFRQRLVETEAQLGRVFEDSPLGILIIERGTRILKANPAFRQLLGADKLCLEGRALTDLVHPDSRERVGTFLEHLIQQQTIDAAEEVCLAGDSTTAWVNLRGSWIRESANPAQTCMVIVEDITERRKTEKALRETEVRLLRGQRMEAIGMFAGGVAHDFNNFLTVIFGCCERLLGLEELRGEGRRYAEEILQTAKTASGLTRQLLAFARQQPRSDQVIELNRLVIETASLLQRLMGPRIELETELAPDVGRVRADPSQLQQVLMNLAANARDAMQAGGRLTIRTSRTKVAASESVEASSSGGQYVTLQVTDTGHGMDETTRAHIFEPLFTTKDLEKGTGLGLATVHSIVTKLGGYIGVESSPGNGTCFRIQLPSAILDPEEQVVEHSAVSAIN
jgi:PAS domain S-box-containing protein